MGAHISRQTVYSGRRKIGVHRDGRKVKYSLTDGCSGISRQQLEATEGGNWEKASILIGLEYVGKLQQRASTDYENVTTWFHRLCECNTGIEAENYSNFVR